MEPLASPSSRALLFVDAALACGAATPRQAATALLATWEGRLPGVEDARDALIRMVGIDRETVRALDERVEEAVDPGPAGATLRPALPSTQDDPGRARDGLAGAAAVALRAPPLERYRDFLPIGQGGMGVVYAARDVAMNRTVAFKVLRPAGSPAAEDVTPVAPFAIAPPADDAPDRTRYASARTRFLQEAWVAGGMEHPGVVPVYEVGSTAAGVPYYTMRLVRGHRTLRTALDEVAGRPLTARLALLEPFLRVCDTIRYAHSRGVLHRDLKPDNVALGEYGETFVVDWGLARLAEEREDARDGWQEGIELLRRGADFATGRGVVGTLGYAAPEALGGDLAAIGPASDVYGLGVILFEILTGRLPFDPREAGRLEAQRAREAAPDARTLEADVPPALAALVADALTPDPGGRPADVAALAERVREWQADVARDRQVRGWMAEAEAALVAAADLEEAPLFRQLERATTACRRVLERAPGHEGARALLARGRDLGEAALQRQRARWRRRQLRRFGVATLAVLVVAGAVVSTLLEKRRREAETAGAAATRARAAEAHHRDRAERTMGFMLDDLQQDLESMGRLDLLAELGEQARTHYAPLPVEADTPESFRRRVDALRKLGDVHLAMGRLPAARATYEEARALAARYAAAHPEDPRGPLARHRARVHLADVDRRQGFAHRALARLDLLVPALEAALDDPRVAGEADLVAMLGATRREARTVEGKAALVAGDYARAHAALEAARAVGEAAEAGVGAVPERDAAEAARRRLATELDLVLAESHAGRADAARERAAAAVEAARRELRSRPADVPARALLADALGVLSRVEAPRDEDAAARAADEALARLGALSAASPENLRWRAGLATLHTRRGDLHVAAEEEAAARRSYAEAHRIAEALVAADPTNAIWLNHVITTCDRRAFLLEGDSEEVRRLRRLAVRHARTLYALDRENPRWKLILAYTLMVAHPSGGPETRAPRLGELEEGYGLAREVLGEIPGPADVASIFVGLADQRALSLERDGRPAEALVLLGATFDDLLRLARDHPRSDGPWYGLRAASERFASRFASLGPEGRAEHRRQARAWAAALEAALADATLAPGRRSALESDVDHARARLASFAAEDAPGRDPSEEAAR